MKDESDKFYFQDQSKKGLIHLLDAYQNAMDQSIISSITDVKGTIIYANKKFCEVTKYSEEELIGKTHGVINSKHHPKEFFKEMWRTIGNGDIWRNEVKNTAKDGSYYWVDTVIIPVRDNDGKIVQYLSLRLLINEKKQIEENRLNYIKALEEMLFMTSHKVRKPISTFMGLMELIDVDKGLNDEEQIQVLQYAKDSAVELDNYIKELTYFIYTIKEENANRWNN